MAQNVVSSRLKSHDYIAYIAYITTKLVGLLALSFRLPTLPTNTGTRLLSAADIAHTQKVKSKTV